MCGICISSLVGNIKWLSGQTNAFVFDWIFYIDISRCHFQYFRYIVGVTKYIYLKVYLNVVVEKRNISGV
jgi:hypothetical protein